MSWHRNGLAVLSLLLTAACQGSEPEQHPLEASRPPAPAATEDRPGQAGAAGRRVESIDDPRVTQSSGLARSTRHPGVLYTHNDRAAASPELFAVDSSGTRAVLRLDAAALDWEDMASTPDGRLWVGDIGDNEGVRTSVSVSVVTEPPVLASGSLPTTTYDFRYPDGPHNAEALLVHPDTGRVYIVTKSSSAGRVYVGPPELSSGHTNLLEHLAGVQAPVNVTAGDFSPDGSSLVLRNQGRAFFYRELGDSPTVVPLPDQPQGESITFEVDGAHVLVGSEGTGSAVLRLDVPELGD